MKHLRWIALSVILSVAGYGSWVAMQDAERILQAVERVGGGGLLLLLMLSLGNYLLRYTRWFALLRHLGDRVPWWDSLLCYWAGFALTTTPGKAGEAIRCLYFNTRHAVGNPHSMAAMLAERLADLLSALLIATIALWYFAELRWMAWAMLALVAVIMTVVFRPALLLTLTEKLAPHLPAVLQPALNAVPAFLQRSAQLLDPRVLLACSGLGLLSWGLEAYGFGWLAQQLGCEADLLLLAGIFCVAMLAGAMTFLPGGLGGTEAVMFLLLTHVGMAHPAALAVTLLCRLATLWFAVVLGLIAMLVLQYRPVCPRMHKQ